jgi:hypothetical protein
MTDDVVDPAAIREKIKAKIEPPEEGVQFITPLTLEGERR